MGNFSAKLSGLVAAEMNDACQARDPERCAAAIEQLLRNTALSIAMACRGESEGINTMLEGATQYLFERSADFAKVGALIGMPAGEDRP